MVRKKVINISGSESTLTRFVSNVAKGSRLDVFFLLRSHLGDLRPSSRGSM